MQSILSTSQRNGHPVLGQVPPGLVDSHSVAATLRSQFGEIHYEIANAIFFGEEVLLFRREGFEDDDCRGDDGDDDVPLLVQLRGRWPRRKRLESKRAWNTTS